MLQSSSVVRLGNAAETPAFWR